MSVHQNGNLTAERGAPTAPQNREKKEKDGF